MAAKKSTFCHSFGKSQDVASGTGVGGQRSFDIYEARNSPPYVAAVVQKSLKISASHRPSG